MSKLRVVKIIDPQVVVTGGLATRGAYNAATDYAVGDSVSYSGSSYVMFNDAPVGTLPTNTTYWQILAHKGDPGVGAGGVGLPTGGTTDQVLSKLSNDNYDVGFVNRYYELDVNDDIMPAAA